MLSDLITYIRDLEGLHPSEKLMLFQLCSYAGPDGQNIRPGQEILARQMNLSERQIRRIIDKLIVLKYVEEDGWKWRNKQYRIPIEKLIPDYAERQAARKLKKTKLVAAPQQEQNLLVVPPDTQPLSADLSRPLPQAYEDWRQRRPGEGVVAWSRRIERGR